MNREAGARRGWRSVAVASAFGLAVTLCLGYLAMWVNLGALVAREPGASIAGGYYLMIALPIGFVLSFLGVVLWDLGARRLSISILLVAACCAAVILTGLAARTGRWMFG